jgi:hypothetical protein
MKKFFAFLIILLPFQILISQEENKHPILTDKFQIDIGIFYPSKTTKFGADGSAPDEDIDFGKTFGFNDNELTFFSNFDWHFSKKWKFSVEFFSIRNANRSELEEEIIWQDIVFKKGTFARAGFGFNLYRIYIGRIFSKGSKHEFGGGLGVHALNTSAFIEGNIAINESDFEFERRSVSALIPLPNIGIWYYYAPNTKLALLARIDWFAITIGEYSGGLLNIAPGIKYQFFRNIGIGLDYRYFNVNARVNQSSWKGKIDLSFKGPLLTIYTNF